MNNCGVGFADGHSVLFLSKNKGAGGALLLKCNESINRNQFGIFQCIRIIVKENFCGDGDFGFVC